MKLLGRLYNIRFYIKEDMPSDEIHLTNHIMTKQERLQDIETILNDLHNQVFGVEGDIEQAEQFQKLGLDIDSVCIALDDIGELKKLI